MKLNLTSASWWGAPKKFSSEEKERKISWLELFYDLVYVIAIARITEFLSEDHTIGGFFQYLMLFTTIFWGWVNGSLYHDLHGSDGLRTRLMTLWQMLIISAMMVILDHHEGKLHNNVVIIIMIMQLYITYLWWSVGIYDKAHRRLNLPYSILYMLSFFLFGLSIFFDSSVRPWIFAIAILINYLPPFVTYWIRRKRPSLLSLSSSMAERLGLFAIILFGEVIAGLIGGEEVIKTTNATSWIQFGLSVIIVFTLWWIFFTLISDRKCKPGLLFGATLEIVYLLTLIALGILGMAFKGILSPEETGNLSRDSLMTIFGIAIATILAGIYVMIFLIEFSNQYTRLRNSIQRLILYGVLALVAISLLSPQFQMTTFLILVLLILLVLIGMMNLQWYSRYEQLKSIEASEKKDTEQ